MLKYKLTTQNDTTFNETKWGENVTHETSGKGWLCTAGWLHYYHHPMLSVLFNPVHAAIKKPKLWECEAEGEHLDDRGIKGGCTKLTTLREIPLPEMTIDQRIKFAILCAKLVNNNEAWNEWADRLIAKETIDPFFDNSKWIKDGSPAVDLYKSLFYVLYPIDQAVINHKATYKDLGNLVPGNCASAITAVTTHLYVSIDFAPIIEQCSV